MSRVMKLKPKTCSNYISSCQHLKQVWFSGCNWMKPPLCDSRAQCWEGPRHHTSPIIGVLPSPLSLTETLWFLWCSAATPTLISVDSHLFKALFSLSSWHHRDTPHSHHVSALFVHTVMILAKESQCLSYLTSYKMYPGVISPLSV